MTGFGMARWLRFLLQLTALLSFQRENTTAFSSVHQVVGPSNGFTLREHMYADRHGPWGIAGRSTVRVNATIAPLAADQVADSITAARLHDYFELAVVIVSFTDLERLKDLEEQTACARNYSSAREDEGNVDGLLHGTLYTVRDEELRIELEFHPRNSGLQVVMMLPCWRQKDASYGYPVSTTEFAPYPMVDPLLSIEAQVAFRNPYGYLPGLLYGLFPFNGVLSLLYGFVDVAFVIMINRHRQSAIRVHYYILAVLLLATGEALCWYLAYRFLNETGHVICCPFPSWVILSTVAKCGVGVVARVLTTLVCLGYGIVRCRISWSEVFVIAGLATCYFVAVAALQIAHIMNQADGETKPPVVWEFLVFATNGCFAGWIFMSLVLTRKALAMTAQTAKLKVYSSLTMILVGYVTISFALMFFEGAVYSGTVMMPWTDMWMIWAANRVLVFSLLVLIAIVWRPTQSSHLYALVQQQIPPQEPHPEEGPEESNECDNDQQTLELVRRAPTEREQCAD